MATIKSFTDLSQSKVLAEILPLKSADMHWIRLFYDNKPSDWKAELGKPIKSCGDIECWSLTALFSVLPKSTDIVKEEADTENERYMCTIGAKDDIISTFGNNPVDACYEMILKLHELKML